METRPIPSWPGYFCDAAGQIYSARRGGMRLMRKRVARTGYEVIALFDGKKYRYPLVHRLVLESWVGPGGDRQCNHKNGIRADNQLGNLEWATRSENERHARQQLGKLIHGAHHPRAKITDDVVREIRRLRREGRTYQSLADQFGIALSHAARVANGKVWQHVEC